MFNLILREIFNWSTQTPTVYARRHPSINYSSTGGGECTDHKRFYSNPSCTNLISQNTFGSWSYYHGLADTTTQFAGSYYCTQRSEGIHGIFGERSVGGRTYTFINDNTCLRIWIR